MLIADRFTEARWADAALAAVRAGVRWVHLRDHRAPPAVFERDAERLVTRVRADAPETRVSVNTRLDVARRLGLDVHVGTRGPAVADARGAFPDAVLGTSSHGVADVQAALAARADYVWFSPIFPTPSKPGHRGAGLDALRAVCAAVSIPVYALGGVTPPNADACLGAGAYGVAVLSGILHASDPAAAARAYAAALPAPSAS